MVGTSFYVIATLLTSLVSDDLFEQRIRQDSHAIEALATTIAPFFSSADGAALSEKLTASGGEMGGRLLLCDAEGKVQVDTYGEMTGRRSQLPQVLSVLIGGAASDWGVHETASGDSVSVCSARVCAVSGETLGVLLYVSSVQEMMESLRAVQMRMLRFFALVAGAAMALALVFSQVLTRPLGALTRTIRRMGQGDLSVRAPVKGSSELRNLATAYNTMAAQLESLDHSRSQFVSNASHELKTPMTSMKIMLQTLIAQPEMPEDLRTEFMQDMDHEIDRLTGIINDLLTLSRMDAGAVGLKLDRIDLTSLIDQTVHRLASLVEERGQHLTCAFPEELCLIGDAGRLSQVFYNLIENATKYVPAAGHIDLTLEKSGKSAIFTVADDGPGIPAEDLPHIFERFYRVDKARSRETGGTGLGLSIVRQIVNMHGGTVTCDSTLGAGCVFRVTLPLTGPASEGRTAK